MKAAEAVASFVLDADLTNPGPVAIGAATRAFLDTVAVGLAGAQEPAAGIIAGIDPIGPVDGSATLLHGLRHTGARQAALANGVACHVLDFDDHVNDVKGHPSCVIVPAVLALGQSGQMAGREVIEAYLVGYQVMCALGQGLDAQHHWLHGWHATGTEGVIAATAAAARLVGLDHRATLDAFGIATSMASSTRQNAGSMTKSLHAGLAAAHALLAVELAGAGYGADPDALDGRHGFLNLFSDVPEADRVIETLDERWSIEVHGINVKRYPSCYPTHRSADAALALHRRGVRAEDVDSIRILVQPEGLAGIALLPPDTGLRAKFSLSYVVATALLDGEVPMRVFTDAAVQRPQVRRLVSLTNCQEADVPPVGPEDWDHAFAVVEVTRRDGSIVRERRDFPHGYASDPLSSAELDEKFRSCANIARLDGVDELLRRMWSLPDILNVAALFDGLAVDA